MNKAGLLLIGLAGLLMTGCTWTGSDGAHRTLILGFGVVTHTNDTGIAVQHTRVLGAMGSARRRGGSDAAAPGGN